MPQQSQPIRLLAVFAVLGLCFLVVSVFFPVTGYDWTGMDVTEQIEENLHIRGLTAENVQHILTRRCIRSYYPVRTLTFAMDYAIWGLDPMGFKLTNSAIHLANVLLVFWLALRLLRLSTKEDENQASWRDMVLAAFAAAVFAVHPVVIEPVAWICGREELLLGLGALGCIHFHLTARRLEATGGSVAARVACHAGAAMACAVACFSNVVGATIPLLITAADLIMVPRPRWWKTILGTAPLWLLSGSAVVIKQLTPDIGVQVTAEPGILSLVRLRLALGVYCLNLRTLGWPTRLAAYYGQGLPASFLDWRVFWGGVSVVATGVVVWTVRRQSAVLLGLAWFFLALGPASQVIPHHIYRADRFLYLPLVGLVVAAAAAVRPWLRAVKPSTIALGATGAAYVWLLAWVATEQHQVWRDNVSLWQHAVRLVPRSSSVHSMLADSLADSGRFEEAVNRYKESLRLDRDNVTAINNYASLLAACDDKQFRNYPEAIRLAEEGCKLTGWHDPDLPGTLAKAYGGYAAELAIQKEFGPAIEYYRKSLKISPKDRVALLKFSHLLATCDDESLRDPPQSVRLAEEARRLVKEPDPQTLSVLASAYAAAGRFAEAVAAVEQALSLAESANNTDLAGALRTLDAHYRKQAPPGTL